MRTGGMSLGQSLDLPSLDRVDTLAQELALLQDRASVVLPCSEAATYLWWRFI